MSELQSNRELGLDLRALVGAGIGRTTFQTNRTLLRGATGLAALEEWSVEGESDEEVEAFLTGNYEFFTFDYPNTNIDISVQAYHGLSSDGGLRLEADLSVKREPVKDFYFSVGVYDSYDTIPSSPTASENDYGLTTSLGWSS